MDAPPPLVETVPLSLYVHIPWCVRKCPYCDFNSHAAPGELPEAVYLGALMRDLEQDLPGVWGRRVLSVFIGGGTPSLFSPEAIERLLSGLRARVPLAPDAEITLEANPGTVETGRFRAFREAGVNRLSIGIQSFDDDGLRAIGRVHDGAQALRAAEAAHSAGFENINLDLMYGLPGQRVDGALSDVAAVLSLAPTHVSHYQLTLEPNTPFHHHPPALPDEEALWAMEQVCQERLAAAGYDRYEVSAYARGGRWCAHNLNYWRFGDYLGIGAGAHGKVTDATAVVRRSKPRHPQAYLGGAPFVDGERVLSGDDLVLEFMLNALRLVDGVPLGLFQAHTGLPLARVKRVLAEAGERGLLERTVAHIRPSPLGLRYLNELIALFMGGAEG